MARITHILKIAGPTINPLAFFAGFTLAELAWLVIRIIWVSWHVTTYNQFFGLKRIKLVRRRAAVNTNPVEVSRTAEVMKTVSRAKRILNLPNLLNITSSRARAIFNDLKLHRDSWLDSAITLPRDSGKVKEHIFS